ncbi:lumican-like isoform X2 [Planococcus citri]|uniref:lumican-like isoform X2 n=1 Tax=Planococcus citri TaxID=170843 RepID=UPI0031F8AD7E
MFKLIVKISTDIKCSILRIGTGRRLLLILILIALPFGKICWNGGRQGCRVYTSSNVHIADCSLLQMAVDVPNDLDPRIEVMNLSGNHLTNISDRSFERYKDTLISLDLSNMSHFKSLNITYDDKSFTGLRKLEYLDISHSCIVRHKFRFPSSLKTLKMERCELNSLNFSHMRGLEELHAASCNLDDLPLIHKQSPLKFLDLRRNNLAKLRVETIAQFCQLKQFHLEIPDGEGLQNPKTYCQCILIESWLNNTGVRHEHLNCTKRSESNMKPTNCTSQPSESTMNLRRDCMAKLSPYVITPVQTNWTLIGIVLLAVFSLLILPSFVYTRTRLRRKRKRSVTNDQVQEEEYEEETEEEVHHYDHYDYGYGYYYQ